MISFSSSIVCVTGCKRPKRSQTPGTVGSDCRASAAGPATLANRPTADSCDASIACLTSLKRFPAAGLSALSTEPRPFWTALMRPFFAPRNSNSGVFERGGIARGAEGGRRFAGK